MLPKGFKKIKGHERYAVSKDGKVWSTITKRLLKKALIGGNNKDQKYHAVRIDGKLEYVHRLVAKTYIPNPDNKPEVNHKDFSKLNNKLENLEWVTRNENMKHYKGKKNAKNS